MSSGINDSALYEKRNESDNDIRKPIKNYSPLRKRSLDYSPFENELAAPLRAPKYPVTSTLRKRSRSKSGGQLTFKNQNGAASDPNSTNVKQAKKLILGQKHLEDALQKVDAYGADRLNECVEVMEQMQKKIGRYQTVEKESAK